MTVQERKTPNYGRRILLARRLRRRPVRRLQRRLVLSRRPVGRRAPRRRSPALNRDGVTAECDNPVARGFPFRIGLYCDSVAYADAAEGSRPDGRQLPLGRADLRSDALRRRARRPGDGSPRRSNGSLKLDWEKLRASVRWATAAAGARLGRRRRRRGEPPRRARRSPRSAPSRRICGRTAQDLDLAGSFDGPGARPGAARRRARCRRSPAQSDLTIKDGVDAARLRPAEPARPAPARSATPDAVDRRRDRASVSGPFSIGEDGLARRRPEGDGARPEGPVGDAWPRPFPRSASEISQQLFRRSRCMGDDPTLPLKIEQGQGDARLHSAGRNSAAEIAGCSIPGGRRASDARSPGGRSRARRFPGRPR